MEAGPGSPAAPAWCERNWHDGQCCEASAEQYALEEGPAFPLPAGAEAPETAAAHPGSGMLGEAIGAYQKRIRRLDAMTPQQLLEFAVFVAGAEPELADQALDILGQG